MARQVEIFVTGCPLCDEAVQLVNGLVCPSCEVTIHRLNESGEAVEKARQYGVTSVPTVVVNGQIVECCQRSPVSAEALKAAGIGQPL